MVNGGLRQLGVRSLSGPRDALAEFHLQQGRAHERVLRLVCKFPAGSVHGLRDRSGAED